MEKLLKDVIDQKIPVIKEDTLKFLINFIKENKIKTILEIGTAIGYSAINMALIDDEITITTIERDELRYHQAVDNVKRLKLENQINIIHDDAFNVNLDKYDLVFIDGAKAQNIKFFEKFKSNLNEKGFIITDNISFHNLVNNSSTITSKNLRNLVKKIENYIIFLKENEDFETKFYEIGDGLSVSYKK